MNQKYILINPNTGKQIMEGKQVYNSLIENGIAPIRIKESEYIIKNNNNFSYKNKVEKILKLTGCKIINSPHNGDCFFKAISKALKIKSEVLRKDVSENITIEHLNFWKEIWENTLSEEFDFMCDVNTIKELREKIKTNEFWGEEVSIEILQKKYNLGIIIIDGITEKIFKNFDISDDKEYIILYYNKNHYNLIKYNNLLIFNNNNLPNILN